jgi:hypothetical protein
LYSPAPKIWVPHPSFYRVGLLPFAVLAFRFFLRVTAPPPVILNKVKDLSPSRNYNSTLVPKTAAPTPGFRQYRPLLEDSWRKRNAAAHSHREDEPIRYS